MNETTTLTATDTAAVRCTGVTKTFGEGSTAVQALRGIDLTVMPGELMMLVGPSGCGKTTLISVIAGILNHDAGECLIFGNNLKRASHRERTAFRGRNLGFVFQAYNLIPALNAVENIMVPLLLNDVPNRVARSQAEAMLEKVGLADRRDAKPSQLSGGQQQRIAIARALIHQPRLVVCDEPTSALDHDTGKIIMELLRSVAVTPQRSLIIVTHDARIFSFADRVATMDDGRITQITSSAPLVSGASP